MQRYIIVFAAVMHFKLMIRFVVAPCSGDQINEIVDAVFDKPDFQSSQAAVIGNGALSIAVFASRYDNTS